MLKLRPSSCLYAASLAVAGVLLLPAAPAEILHQPHLQTLLGSSDRAVTSDPAVPSVGGNATLPTASENPSPEILGDTYVIRHRYQAAIRAYTKAPQMTAVLWDKLGIAYQLMLADDAAIRCYRESIKLDPTHADAINNLATVYQSQGRFDEAEREYRAAIKLAPQSAMMLKNLGTDLMVQGKYSQGWEAYQQALAIDPEIFSTYDGPSIGNAATTQGHGAVRYYMALASLRAGHSDAAIEQLRAAMNDGFLTPKKVAKDKNFAALRDNPAFQQLLAEQRAR